ncbi:MAG: hypothetical protein AB9891_06050 [Anaerolineaceae bacterium]
MCLPSFSTILITGAAGKDGRVFLHRLLTLVLLSFVLSGCAVTPPTPQTVEVTRIVEATRIVEITEEVTPQTGPTLPPAMAFPADCLTRQPGMDYSVYDWLEIQTIGGCSYLSPSPDGKYLAYSTRVCLDASTCGEAVRILAAGASDAVTIQFMPCARKRWVASLGWSSTGELAVSYNNINSGAGVYVFGEPFDEDQAEGVMVTGGALRQWNENRTAFVTFGALGGGYCDARVGGYDFATGKAFPDIAAILGRDPLELNILPFNSSYQSTNWWIGKDEIPLLITPLDYDPAKEDQKFLPTMVGKITLTPAGPEYTTLAGSATESYSITFAPDDSYSAQPKPYQVRYCNE